MNQEDNELLAEIRHIRRKDNDVGARKNINDVLDDTAKSKSDLFKNVLSIALTLATGIVVVTIWFSNVTADVQHIKHSIKINRTESTEHHNVLMERSSTNETELSTLRSEFRNYYTDIRLFKNNVETRLINIDKEITSLEGRITSLAGNDIVSNTEIREIHYEIRQLQRDYDALKSK